MSEYLSSAWFDRLREQVGHVAAAAPGALVVRNVVSGAPGAVRVSYDVVVTTEGSHAVADSGRPADITLRTDYETASAVAAGRLSTQAALEQGRLKVSGDLGALGRAAAMIGAGPTEGAQDPLPGSLRAETTFARR